MKVTVVGFGITNAPEAITEPYIVTRWCEGKLWYYGQYPSEEKAAEVAEFLGNGIYSKVETLEEDN